MNKKIRTIVIDDEPLSIKRIVNLIDEIDNICVIKQCDNGEDGINFIINLQPDLVLIDINLDDMNGFEVITSLPSNINPIVIFVTAHEEFALKAFNHFAFDYLLKPFKDERFFASINKVIEIINRGKSLNTSKSVNNLLSYFENKKSDIRVLNQTQLPFKCNGNIILLKTDSIIYILASGTYSEVFTTKKKYLIRESLTQLIERLPISAFFRIHRSTIVNLNLMEEIIVSNYREVDVKMNDNKVFRVSIKFKDDLLKLVGV